jgi:hypothetical protein
MEPVLIVLIAGVLGGIILAALIFSKRIDLHGDGVDRQLAPPSPSLINMAHIRVEGGGGLGIVAAIILVALVDPRIRSLMAIAALSGVVLAAGLIARRRARGPLTSAGDDAGPHSMLGLDRKKTQPDDPARLPPSQPGPGGLRLVLPSA